MKTGGNVTNLKQEFEKAYRALGQKKPAQATGFRSPIQRLRDQVPQVPNPKMQRFDCDPALVLERDGKGLWDKYLREAEGVMSAFNQALSAAIQGDEASKAGGTCLISNFQYQADIVLRWSKYILEEEVRKPDARRACYAGISSEVFWR